MDERFHFQEAFFWCFLIGGAVMVLVTLIEFRLAPRRKLRRMDKQTKMLLNQFHPDGVTLDASEFPQLFELLAFHPKPYLVQAVSEEAWSLYNSVAPDALPYLWDTGKNWWNVEPALWRKHCRSHLTYAALLCIASTHRNGYLREKALLLLPESEFSLCYVLLRVNDWVKPIRETAASMLPRIIDTASPDALIGAMPYFERVRRSERIFRDEIYDLSKIEPKILHRIAEKPESLFHAALQNRRLCYQMLLRAEWQDEWEPMLCLWMAGETDGMQRDILHRHFLRNAKQIAPEILRTLCVHKRWRIRLEAMERRFREEGIWEDFKQLLFDRAAPVREFAAYRLQQTGFNCAAYCRGNLPAGILALAELGTQSDIPAIRAYREQFPRECLVALVRLNAPDVDEQLWDALHSNTPALAKTAYRMARARHIRFDSDKMIAEIQSDADPQLRWRLFRLLRDWGDWKLLPVLLRMVRDYAHLRPDIVAAIEKRSPNCQSLSPVLAAQIADALEYAGDLLPEKIAKELRFDLHRLT